MDCPHCYKEIPGEACPECGTVVPTASRFCMECGAALSFEPSEPLALPDDNIEDNSDEDDAFSLENRTLCPDGTCTGIIIDGKCIECGKKISGKRPK